MIIFRNFVVKVLFFLVITGLFTPCSAFAAKGVKTRYKQYTIFTYETLDYLCEPYLVQKDDWLYKIFRQKGEISAEDFPLFLRIFKTINPQISNIDAISPGSKILIPLKQVDKNAYQQDKNGMVEVPVLEFSSDVIPATPTPEPASLEQVTVRHEIKAGDTVSELLPKEFLTPGGSVSEAGEKAILHLNPGIKDINRIYQGTSIVIPDPELLSQPWFRDLLAMNRKDPFQPAAPSYIPEEKLEKRTPPKTLSTEDIGHLKRYTHLIQGHLMHQGRLFFPATDNGEPPRFIDLSKTPVINDSTGRKIVMLGPDEDETSLDPDLVAIMRGYWKDLKFKKFDEVLSANILFNSMTMDDRPESQKSLIQRLLENTDYAWEPDVYFPVSVDNVQMTVSLGRITHERMADILINTGSVYGKGLKAVEDQGYRILNLSANLTFGEVCTRLFSRLGYQCWKDPSFNAGQRVKNIPGIYAEKGTSRHFMTRTLLFKNARTFLKNEKIDLIMLNKEPAL